MSEIQRCPRKTFVQVEDEVSKTSILHPLLTGDRTTLEVFQSPPINYVLLMFRLSGVTRRFNGVWLFRLSGVTPALFSSRHHLAAHYLLLESARPDDRAAAIYSLCKLLKVSNA